MLIIIHRTGLAIRLFCLFSIPVISSCAHLNIPNDMSKLCIANDASKAPDADCPEKKVEAQDRFLDCVVSIGNCSTVIYLK